MSYTKEPLIDSLGIVAYGSNDILHLDTPEDVRRHLSLDFAEELLGSVALRRVTDLELRIASEEDVEEVTYELEVDAIQEIAEAYCEQEQEPESRTPAPRELAVL